MKSSEETDDLIYETCLIGQDITSIHELTLSPNVHTLNLHSNVISRLEGLDVLHNLIHLDLSSNRLGKITGLGTLILLRTLNLSCNGISEIQGLHSLRNLTCFNLSYNCIDNVSGLKELHGPGFRLRQLELQGNRIRSLPQLIECTIGLRSLEVLVLSHNGKDNPVCRSEHYRSLYLQSVPQLIALDGFDREGSKYSPHSSPYDIPGLDQYLEYLSGTSVEALASSVEGKNIMSLATPRIDQALDKFKKFKVASSSATSDDPTQDEGSVGKTEIPRKTQTPQGSVGRTEIPQKQTDDTGTDLNSKRLEMIESKLEELLSAAQTQPPSQSSVRGAGGVQGSVRGAGKPRPVIDSESSEQEEAGVTHPQRRKQLSRTTNTKLSRTTNTKLPTQPKKTMTAGVREGSGVTSSQKVREGSGVTSSQKVRVPLVVRHPAERDYGGLTVTEESNYLQLMKEFEIERDRRWKAENATKILTEQLKHLETNSFKEREFQGVAVEATQRLKQALVDTREDKSHLEDELNTLRNRNEHLTSQLLKSQEAHSDQDQALSAAKSALAKIEKERIGDQEGLTRFRRDAQLKIQAVVRENEILKSTVKKSQEKTTGLQEIIANKEREHQNTTKTLFSLHSPEFQQHLDRQLGQFKTLHEEQLKLENGRYEMLGEKYHELENEFRTALHIEAERFNQVKTAYDNVLKTSETSRLTVDKLTAREKESTELCQDLTAMVKEQKGRITELTRAKNEIFNELRDRNKKLETEVSEARDNLKEFENLRKDKIKLTSHIQAQDSIIQGLRKERQLWDQELAQQGSSLSQDRGRMESKIETLQSQLISLKKQSERDVDSLKIKTKIVEDQTETIRKLKEGLGEKDRVVKETQEKSLQLEKHLQDQITTESRHKEELQDQVDQLINRKEGLKQEVADLKFELDELKNKHTTLNRKWKEKSEIITEVEKQVKQMKVSWSDKEQQLTTDRDTATSTAEAAVHKLHLIDNAFRHQLEAQQLSHDEEKQLLLAEKQMEIDSANERVAVVEAEMRGLLEEQERNKKQMQDRMKELGGIMSGLAQGY